jgi:formylglycine-generating enzyme required for sulfatase activity
MKYLIWMARHSRLSSIVMAVFVFTGCVTEPVNEQPVKGQPLTVSGLGMKFVYVAPGSFQMGSNDGGSWDNEKPVHRVTISRGYWIGKYEVTQSEYQSIMGSNPSNFKGRNNPVETVNWHDAVKFCQKLTTRERVAGRLPSGYEYRLPTEAEWEFAARGGTKSRGYKYSGSDHIDSVAWHGLNSFLNEIQEVGTKSGNELGVYDMSGNVWEWCNDRYGEYSSNSQTDPKGPSTGSARVGRGGGWYYYAGYCRSAFRSSGSPGDSDYSIGFRVAIAPSLK